ncbi:MAG TPA: CBS domain-containing protein [Caulobacteraceae bacterium]|jgi:CBS domain-containing protein|nr:CBS domain-containing protein [Caulobacteraceae bacterium]
MKVRDCMTRQVLTTKPQESLQTAAKLMLESDIGFIPVEDDDRLVGTLTDRDIVVRAIAKGLGPDTRVRDVMTKEVLYCYDDADLDDVADNMADIQVRRLPVVDSGKRLVGVISTGDLARETDGEVCAMAMSGVVQPGGSHNQSTGF